MLVEIILADHAGFCFGVRRAIERALDETAKRGKLYSQGPLIHNRQVVDGLRKKGLEPVDNIDDVPPGSTVMLRTHGVGPSVYEHAEKNSLDVIDATCPFVARAQMEASRLHKANYLVLVLGEPDHPEAQAIREHTGGHAIIVERSADVDFSSLPKRVAVVCQTTQRLEALRELVNALLGHTTELVVVNTICDATSQRQDAVWAMAQNVEVVIVIGGRHSANTTRLAQICTDAGKPTYHIETADEIDCAWFRGVARAGVTAGASTPDEAIDAVLQRIRKCERELAASA